LRQDHAIGVVEFIRTRNHDLIAGGEAVEHLDLLYAGCAEAHRYALGDVAVDHVGEAATVLVHEGATIDHQHIRPLVDEDAHRHALALPQPLGLGITEAHARDHLAIHDLRRDGADAAGPVLAIPLDVRAHAGRQITRLAFGYVDLHLQSRQVHDRDERRVLRDSGAILGLYLADAAVDRRADLQRGDLALQILHQIILVLEHLQLGIGAEFVGLPAAIEVALRGGLIDLRLLIGFLQLSKL